MLEYQHPSCQQLKMLEFLLIASSHYFQHVSKRKQREKKTGQLKTLGFLQHVVSTKTLDRAVCHSSHNILTPASTSSCVCSNMQCEHFVINVFVLGIPEIRGF